MSAPFFLSSKPDRATFLFSSSRSCVIISLFAFDKVSPIGYYWQVLGPFYVDFGILLSLRFFFVTSFFYPERVFLVFPPPLEKDDAWGVCWDGAPSWEYGDLFLFVLF